MDRDDISEIGIDNQGRLFVKPASRTFAYIYREAMEIHWDAAGRYLYAPAPASARNASLDWWYRRILAAAQEQGCELQFCPQTRLENCPYEVRRALMLRDGPDSGPSK